MSTPAQNLPKLDHLFEPDPPTPKAAREPRAPARPYGAFDSFQPAGSAWSISGAGKVKDYFRSTYGRDLPVTAEGESATHRARGLDHSNSLDVGLHPDSEEGRALRDYLKQNNIPYLAYDRAVPGAATGAHIHVGTPSHGLGAEPAPPSLPDLSTLFEPDDSKPQLPAVKLNAQGDEVEQSYTSAAAAAPRLPQIKPQTFDPATAVGRATRGATARAAEQPGARTLSTVALPAGREDWLDVPADELMSRAYSEGARREGIPESFVSSWLKQNPHARELVHTATGQKVTPADLIGTDAYDSDRRAMTVALAELPQMKRDYEAWRSHGAHALDALTDERTSAGEKFTNALDPVAHAGARALDLASRPFAAADAAAWSKAKRLVKGDASALSPDDPRAAIAATQAFMGEPSEEGANPVGAAVRNSETLRRINPNLPGMAGGLAEMLTSPSNLLPLEEIASGGKLLRGLKPVARLEEALKASKDAKAAEFFAKGGRILDLEVPAARAVEGATPRLGVVTFRDPEGRIFKLDTSTGELSGDVPPVASLVPPPSAANPVGARSSAEPPRAHGPVSRVVADSMPDFARLGAYHIQNGADDYARWSAAMVEDLGDSVTPHLPEIYAEAQKGAGLGQAAGLPKLDHLFEREPAPQLTAPPTVAPAAELPPLDHLFEPEPTSPSEVQAPELQKQSATHPAFSGGRMISTRAELEQAAQGGRIAPFGEGGGRSEGFKPGTAEWDSIKEGRRPFGFGSQIVDADTGKALDNEYKQVAKWAERDGLAVSFIDPDNWVVARDQAAADRAAREIAALDEDAPDYFARVGKMLSYSDADVARYYLGRYDDFAPPELPKLDHLFEPEHHSTRQPRDAGGTFKAGTPEASNFINLDRLNVSDAEKQSLSKLVSDYVAEKKYNKDRVTFADVKKEAAQLDPSLVRDLKPLRDSDALTPAVRYAAKQRLSALNSELLKAQDAISAGRDALPLDDLHKLEVRAAELKRDADAMLDVLIPLRTQVGRTLAMERMMVDATGFDLEKSVARARRLAERSGLDARGEELQKAEGTIRQTVARGAEAQKRLDELEAKIEAAQVAPEIRAAAEEAAKAKARKLSDREVSAAARRAVAESYKAKLTEMEQAARARLRGKLSPNALHDVNGVASMIADLSVVGAAKLARGGIDRAVWATEMIEEFGDALTPHLRAVFAKSYELYRSEKAAAARKAAELKVTGGDLSKFITAEIEQLLNEAAAQRARVQRARMDLAKTYASLQKTDKWSTASAIRKSNLLLTVSGAARDVVSTGLFQPTEQIARIPGSLADLTLSLVSKNDRQLLTAQPASLFSATREGYAKAAREIPEVMRRGATKEQLQRLELPHEINSGNRVIDAYVKVVGRYRTAVDLPAYNQAEAFALRERAKLQAMAEKKAGKVTDVRARTAELVKAPPDSLRILAATDASEVTFHNTTRASEVVRRARTALTTRGNFVLDLFLPFERATSGVIHKGAQYAGLGIPEAGYRTLRALVKRELSAQEQRSISLAFGRGATGVLAFVPLGYALAARGVMTGVVDDEPGQRGLKQIAGSKPMSIYNPVTGGWINIDVLGPAALPLAIGATIYQERTQPKGARAGEYAKQIARLAVTAPQVRATGEVARLADDPAATLPGFVGRSVSSFVAPGIASEIGNLADSKERETNSFVGGVASRVPVARNFLPEKLDALGSPVTGHSNESDPLVAEAMRIRLPMDKPKQDEGETAEAYRARLPREGAAVRASLSSLFSSARYKSLPDDDTRRAVASGVMEYARGAERKGLPREAVAHNSMVRAEAVRVAEALKRDRTLTDAQREYVTSRVSQLLSSAMFRKGEGRNVEEAQKELSGLISDLESSLRGFVREARDARPASR